MTRDRSGGVAPELVDIRMTRTERQEQRGQGIRAIGRALRHRNYRLFFAGQSISLIGTWITRDRDQLARLPADRLGAPARHRRLRRPDPDVPARAVRRRAGRSLGTATASWSSPRCSSMLQSAALAALALAGTITVAARPRAQHLPGADQRVRHAGAPGVRGRDGRDARRPAATRSRSTRRWSTAARLLGPSIGGVLIAAVGEGWCFAIDAVSYLAVIASLLAMRLRSRRRRVAGDRSARSSELREGFRYACRFRADPSRCSAARAGEPDGHALHGADAGHRGPRARRRRRTRSAC